MLSGKSVIEGGGGGIIKLLKKIHNNKTVFGSFIVFILWYIFHIIVNSNIIPGPYETIVTLGNLMAGNLFLHIVISLLRITVAVAISLGIGIPFGLWLGLSKRVDALISPVIYILYPIPKVAFLPLFMILFGLGNSSKIILIISIIVFQIIITVRDGVKEIPVEMYHSVKTLGLNQWQIYIHLVIPAVLPKIISALRVSIGVSIATLFFSENFYYIRNRLFYYELLGYGRLYADVCWNPVYEYYVNSHF